MLVNMSLIAIWTTIALGVSHYSTFVSGNSTCCLRSHRQTTVSSITWLRTYQQAVLARGRKNILPRCEIRWNHFRGREKTKLMVKSINYLEEKFDGSDMGGRWRPTGTRRAKRIAIIIPFRDRHKHLNQLLHNLIPKLRRQRVDYTFYVIEQTHGCHFNRGMIKNIGFVEAQKRAKYDCYIFNDVDTIIENDLNMYTCLHGVVLHLAPLMQRFNYRSYHPTFLGGIVSFTEDLFDKVNGYSNFLFVWGKEDDDIWKRICFGAGGSVEASPTSIGHVTTLDHERDEIKEERLLIYDEIEAFANKDGINSLNYSIITVSKQRLFTWIKVDINETYYIKLFDEYKRNRPLKGVVMNTINHEERRNSTETGRCTVDPKHLRGVEPIDFKQHSYDFLENKFSDTEPGGRWHSHTCNMTLRVAIIIPCNDSDLYLRQLLNNLIPKLRRQKIDYTFYVMEQELGSRYNKGLLKNIAFLQAKQKATYDCYIFNDVDFVVENDLNMYTCTWGDIRHLSASVHRFGLHIELDSPISGKVSFTEEVFIRVNGYSNFYFENGDEDADMYRRISTSESHKNRLRKPNPATSSTVKLSDEHRSGNRSLIYNKVLPFVHKDGLNSVNYKILSLEKRKLFTRIYVQINESYYQMLLKTYEDQLMRQNEEIAKL